MSLQEVGQQPAGEGDGRHVGGAHRRPPHVSTTSGLMRLFYYIFVDNVLNWQLGKNSLHTESH